MVSTWAGEGTSALAMPESRISPTRPSVIGPPILSRSVRARTRASSSTLRYRGEVAPGVGEARIFV